MSPLASPGLTISTKTTKPSQRQKCPRQHQSKLFPSRRMNPARSQRHRRLRTEPSPSQPCWETSTFRFPCRAWVKRFQCQMWSRNITLCFHSIALHSEETNLFVFLCHKPLHGTSSPARKDRSFSFHELCDRISNLMLAVVGGEAIREAAGRACMAVRTPPASP